MPGQAAAAIYLRLLPQKCSQSDPMGPVLFSLSGGLSVLVPAPELVVPPRLVGEMRGVATTARCAWVRCETAPVLGSDAEMMVESVEACVVQ